MPAAFYFMLWRFCVRFLFCVVVLGVTSSLAIILLRKREFVALLKLYYGCSSFVSRNLLYSGKPINEYFCKQ